jgi:hypothetical protein
MGDELSKPAQNCFRSGDSCNLLETLSAKTFADLGKCGVLIITQP